MIKILKLIDSETADFAARELKKYLTLARNNYDFSIEKREEYNQEENAIWLGLWNQFSLEDPKREDPKFNDAIFIDINSNTGVIAGTNERSILIGVYRFLREIRFRWIRPGLDGEVIPNRDISKVNVRVKEKASYRHRGICIEGAVSYENVADMIDFIPKLGFNSYFIQFREAYTFFERWYSHRNNPLKEKEDFPLEKAREYISKLAREIKKRGLLYHAVGHGWTCEHFGIPGLGWDPYEEEISPDIKQYFAEVNGKRGLWYGIPLNTNLCYSNPEVRRIVVNSIVDYLKTHPEVDTLHFWLADGSNNQCECENCRDILPSDFYVMMLNELDRLLTSEGIDTKIVFLIYLDLLWPPKTERIENSDRFILMFAPITRSYSDTYRTGYGEAHISEYRRNQLSFPRNIDENVSFLEAWQKIFTGDSFDFDYHLMWAHYSDPGYFDISRIIYEDIRNLKNIGINGLISCQIQRVFFPTGLPVYVMAHTLWNDSLGFDNIVEDYFNSAFGKEGEKVKDYLFKISNLFDPPTLRREKLPSKNMLEKLEGVSKEVREFMPLIENGIQKEDKTLSKSWDYLKYHSDIILALASILKSKFKGEDETALELWKDLKGTLQKSEDVLQPVFDLFEFVEVMDSLIKKTIV